jgi:peptidoglycan/LPS O-acetylase OafA/YrhL
MIHHFYHMKKPVGTIGTHFFFALTGFLVAMSLMKIREQVLSGEVSPLKAWYQFTSRRWMRVLPVMWIMLTACFILLSKSDRAHAIWHYALLSNIRMSLEGNYPDYIAHLWWISAMEQTLPIIVLLFMAVPKHHLQKALACMIVVGPAFRIAGYFMQWNYISMRVMPAGFIDIVGLGCLTAVAMKHGNTRLLTAIKWIGACIGLPMMAVALWTIDQTGNDFNKSILFDIGSAWAVCALIIVSYNGLTGVIGDVLASPFFNYFAAISYGLAMWHLFAMAWMTKYFNGASPHIRAAGSFVIATFFASCTYFLVERPIARIKSKSTVVRKPTQSAMDRAPAGNTMPELAKS